MLEARYKKTQHYLNRIQERNIPDIDKIILKRLGRRTRKKIRDSCIKNSCDTKNYIYFMAEINRKNIIYVCSLIDINHFLVITAFKI